MPVATAANLGLRDAALDLGLNEATLGFDLSGALDVGFAFAFNFNFDFDTPTCVHHIVCMCSSTLAPTSTTKHVSMCFLLLRY